MTAGGLHWLLMIGCHASGFGSLISSLTLSPEVFDAPGSGRFLKATLHLEPPAIHQTSTSAQHDILHRFINNRHLLFPLHWTAQCASFLISPIWRPLYSHSPDGATSPSKLCGPVMWTLDRSVLKFDGMISEPLPTSSETCSSVSVSMINVISVSEPIRLPTRSPPGAAPSEWLNKFRRRQTNRQTYKHTNRSTSPSRNAPAFARTA